MTATILNKNSTYNSGGAGSNGNSVTEKNHQLPSADLDAANGSCSQTKSHYRQMLPYILCLISFASVLSILCFYMDTTEIRHQQFRLNMSRDYEMYGVRQDDPTLVTFIREIQMKKYPMAFLKNAPEEHFNVSERHDLVPVMINYINEVLHHRTSGGTFIQSMTGSTNSMLMAPFLVDNYGWNGVIVEPDLRKYIRLRRAHAHKSDVQVVHACLSPDPYPKEVTLHTESEVKVNSLFDEDPEWFNSRVKCFPLYAILLAANRTNIDLLSLGCQGYELQILQTIPLDRVNIRVITIHLADYAKNDETHMKSYARSITRFLRSNSFRLLKVYDEVNYIFINCRSVHQTI